jgi:tRNA-Thr(GGU) m(6)t(6)A37 methyltransferase TsaA
MNAISMCPIGTIHSPFTEQSGTPIQPSVGKDVTGHIELLPDYQRALRDLDGFERIWLIYVFDRAHSWKPLVKPYRDTVERGLFSTRAPSRPCSLGMSAVKLLGVQGCRLEVQGLDVLDGTPLLDIKPYVPEFDAHPESKAGWLDEGRSAVARADGRFATRDR